jgi:hypothetical protein
VRDRVAPFAGGERPARVRVRLAVVVRNGFDHGLRDLCAARPVEEREWLFPVRLGQRRETAADRMDVEIGHD